LIDLKTGPITLFPLIINGRGFQLKEASLEVLVKPLLVAKEAKHAPILGSNAVVGLPKPVWPRY